MGTDFPVIFHYEAFAELEQTKYWYNQQAERLGEAFFQEVQLAISRIQPHHKPGQSTRMAPVVFSCIDSLLELSINTRQ